MKKKEFASDKAARLIQAFYKVLSYREFEKDTSLEGIKQKKEFQDFLDKTEPKPKTYEDLEAQLLASKKDFEAMTGRKVDIQDGMVRKKFAEKITNKIVDSEQSKSSNMWYPSGVFQYKPEMESILNEYINKIEPYFKLYKEGKSYILEMPKVSKINEQLLQTENKHHEEKVMKYQPSLSEISSYWGKFETSRIAKERVSTKEFKIAFREKTEPYRKEDTKRITDDVLEGYINLYAFLNDKEEITDLKTYTIFKKLAFDNIYLSPEYRFINRIHKSLSKTEEGMLDMDVLVKLYTAFDEFVRTKDTREFQDKFQDYYKKVELFADKSLEVGESVFIKGYADRKFSYETGRIEIEKHKEQELYHQGGYDYEILEELELAFKAMSNCLIKFGKQELTLFELKKVLELDALHLANSINTETQTEAPILTEEWTQSEIKEFENQKTQVDFLDRIKAETFLSKSYKLIDIITKYTKELFRIGELEPFLENIKTKHDFYAERIKEATTLEELEVNSELLDKEYRQIELIGQEFIEE